MRAGAIETFLIANLSANAVLLQQIIDQNQLMGLEIDHAIERPDTLVDDCEVCIARTLAILMWRHVRSGWVMAQS